ncbi:Hsp20 family protein [Nisaea acidiphila]|uniref:Hsp20 family protein n=1 Tax=Nisaea acidiphila TaxID=1862145 RepID=A0A9J7AZR4_9PROT|nr:Hsp20 family protein [Nisaea acidiphila]UUX51740.1 Hsp20 family protein [Nisaea acidiphila]
MRTIDFSPMFRNSVGFDRMAQLADAALRSTAQNNAPAYPPYNIEKVSEDDYRITMAVAGFAEQDIDITVKENSLVVTGKVEKSEEGETRQFLHRGIAERAFERRFELADFIKVTGAELENGLLHVSLVREVPEEAKPRKIAVRTGAPAIEGKKAA